MEISITVYQKIEIIAFIVISRIHSSNTSDVEYYTDQVWDFVLFDSHEYICLILCSAILASMFLFSILLALLDFLFVSQDLME